MRQVEKMLELSNFYNNEIQQKSAYIK